jgi:hypothetical protein
MAAGASSRQSWAGAQRRAVSGASCDFWEPWV